MSTTSSLVDIRKSFQALAGLEAMTEMDHFFFERSMNRACKRAYDAVETWERYLVVSEERKIISLRLSGGAGPAPDNTDINQDYQFIGTSSGGDADEGTSIYRGVTKTDCGIFKKTYSTVTRWFIATDLTFTENADGTVTLSSFDTPGDQEFRETSSTSDTPNPAEVTAWTANTFGTGQTGTPVIRGPFALIPKSETGLDTISEFIRIHRKDAFQKNSSIEYDFYVDSDGAHAMNVANSTDKSVYVTYKKEFTPSFTETSTDVPDEFYDFILYTVLSDFYTGDGQTEKALIAEKRAKEMLDRELFKVNNFNNTNTINKKFSTYVNRQSR